MKRNISSVAAQDILLFLFLVAGLGWLIYTYQILISPLIISALLAYLLYPILTWLSKSTKINRQRLVIIVYLIFLGLLAWAIIYVVPLVIKQANMMDSQLEKALDQISMGLLDLNRSLGIELPIDSLIQSLETNLNEMLQPEKIFQLLLSSSSNIIWMVVIVITVFHLLRDWERLREWFFGLLWKEGESDYRILHKEIKNIWQSYLRGQLLIMFFLGLLSGLGAAIVGLPNAFLLGFLAGTLALIPNLGPTIATVIAGLVAWTQGSSYLEVSNLMVMIITVAIFMVVQMIEGFFLTPRIMGRRMSLHPGIVLFAIVGTLLTLGAVMALIIVPTIGSVILIFQFIQRKRAGLDPWPQGEESELVVSEV